jgi:hypothetical protein
MSNSNTGGDLKAPIFDGENFDFWMIKMKTMFVSIDLWNFVEEGYVIPAEYDLLTVNQIIALKRNKKKDAKALGILQNAVTAEIFPRISNEETSKAAWDLLKIEFKGTAKVRAVKLQSLRRDFEYMKMNESILLKTISQI